MNASVPRDANGSREPTAASTDGRPLAPLDCTDCGACCRRNGSPVVVYNSGLNTAGGHPYRPEDLPPHLLAEIDEHFLGLRRGQEPGGACLWYDAKTARCRHYEWRPPACREFEVGCASCLSDRAALQIGPAIDVDARPA